MGLVTSRQNQWVKLARSLRERKVRDRENLFLAEGIRLAVQASQSEASVEAVLMSRDLLRSDLADRAVEGMQATGVRVIEMSKDAFTSVVEREHPQGIAVVARIPRTPLSKAEPHAALCRVCLIEPQDPGNVGTILRTSDAVGAAGIIIIGSGTDGYDSRAVRASMGAVFTQEIFTASVEEFNCWTNNNRLQTVGLSDKAKISYRCAEYQRPLVLVMGSERQGITGSVRLSLEVSIPMRGSVDSLNLSVAAALALYEVSEQLSS